VFAGGAASWLLVTYVRGRRRSDHLRTTR